MQALEVWKSGDAVRRIVSTHPLEDLALTSSAFHEGVGNLPRINRLTRLGFSGRSTAAPDSETEGMLQFATWLSDQPAIPELRDLSLFGPASRRTLAALTECSQLATTTTLTLGGELCDVGAGAVIEFLQAPVFRNLNEVTLSDGGGDNWEAVSEYVRTRWPPR